LPAALLAGCGDGDGSGTGVDAGDGGSVLATDAGKDGAVAALTFKPSNVDLTGLDLSAAGDVVVTGANNVIITETPSFNVDNKALAKIITRQDGTRIALFVMKTLRVEANATLDVMGTLPAVVVALESITVGGTLRCRPGLGGGGVQTMANSKGGGPGGGPGATATGMIVAASGGSFCGVGGAGAADGMGAANTKSMAYGTPELVPLVAGSAGGAGAIASDGQGGGALQLTAGSAINVLAGAVITAPGNGGGSGGLASAQEAGGGGSGGAILLEAPAVTIAGVVAANGGGGGQGFGDNGEAGQPSATAALGGQKMGGKSFGGNGGAGDMANGGDGMFTMGAAAGGGGGGAGRIRINTQSGQPIMGGTLSPSAKTACLSFGKLAM
jgi:hypothetical protein